MEEGDFVLRETAIVHVGESIEVSSEVPHFEEMDTGASMYPMGTVEGLPR